MSLKGQDTVVLLLQELTCSLTMRSRYFIHKVLLFGGDISVDIAQGLEDDSTGVISNVISYITGATDKSGFKGLNGNFIRHSLMHFNQDIPAIRFTRLDTQTSIDLLYDPSSIAVEPKQMQIMKKILAGNADIEEKKLFASLWQERVEKILIDNFDNGTILKIKKV